jgi:hypothetical protein
MKRIVLAIGIVIMCTLACFGKTIEETGNTVIYRTLDDLSADSRRLAETMLSVEKRFPARIKYVIEFTSRSYKYVIVYEPGQDKLTKHVYGPVRFREQYSKKEAQIDGLISRKIYIGNTKQRLLRTKDGSIKDFGFSDDVVTEEGKTVTYAVPAKEV